MRRFLPLAAVIILAACGGKEPAANEPQAADTADAAGMPNPASVFCVQQGGISEVRKKQDGSEYGICVLKDGKEVEEWEYYRANNKQ